MMQDGLYRVETPYLTAGFVVKGGQVTQCAPILRKNFDYYRQIATRVGENVVQARMTMPGETVQGGLF